MSTEKFFRKSDWIACWATFVISLIVYVITLQPTVGLEDSGELIVASDYLGVPHPPGYPSWSLLTWLFQWIFHGVTFHGHPNPAWAVNLFSAVSGAAACGVIALLISRSGMDLLRSLSKESSILGEGTESLFCGVAGITGGLLLAFGHGMWSQSVIAEVYSLNIFFQSLVLIFLYRWLSDTDNHKWLIICAFVFGLGTTNHQTLIFMGLAIAIIVLFKDIGLFRDFAIVGLFLSAILIASKYSSGEEWKWASGPDHKGFWFWSIYAIIVPLIATFALKNGKVVGPTILVMLVGVSFYLYMPISSDQNPPINWGYPRTWQGFMHAITRGQYEKVKLSQVLQDPSHFIHQCESFFRDLRSQYLPLVLTGFLPFAAWRTRRFNASLAAIGCFLIAAMLLTASTVISFKMANSDLLADNLNKASIPFIVALFLLFGIGFGISIANFVEFCFKETIDLVRKQQLGFWNGVSILISGLFGLALLVGLLYVDKALISNLVHHGSEQPFRENLIILSAVLLPYAFIVGSYLLKRWKTSQLSFDISEFGQHWFITTIVAFISVGIVFIILQNPKTDIQSLFIGRVQYIQAHAIYAIWMGYGLLLLMAYVDAFMKNIRAIRYIIVLGILTLPAFLVIKNRIDPTQEKIYGGAEQGGHDFGWQFGNWQLQGVKGIEEDLRAWYSPEEFEKIWGEYPNKNYPQPMGTNAIFFGGTDPGRFVPTYMIYSAHVRPDVYLITQNALADNTYMSVMRDLYGDQIWIPSPLDNNMAFQMYIKNDGQSADVSGGRVQVQGVAAVMKINGYLSKMIFDHNQYLTETKTDEATRPVGSAVVYEDPQMDPETGMPPARTFYVEESYAMQWMYPYLTPHGLIMKVNNKPTPITDEMIKNDTDFWNWYCDRLLNDGKFMRDIVARKSFSKLRSSIAGLYAARGRVKEAEAAFRQAIALYDLSPESNYRLADLLAREGRFDEAVAMFDEFLEKDENNTQAAAFRDQLEQRKSQTAQKQVLEQKRKAGKLQFNEVINLGALYFSAGQIRQADSLMMQYIKGATVTPEQALQIAQLMAQKQRLAVVEQALKKYTALKPDDPGGWINLAALQMVLKRQNDMWSSIDKALEVDPTGARTQLRNDKRFNPIRKSDKFKSRVPSLQNSVDMGLMPGF